MGGLGTRLTARAGAGLLGALLGCALLGLMAGPALAAKHKHKKSKTVTVHCAAAVTVHCQPTTGPVGPTGAAGKTGFPGSILDVFATSTRPWSSSEATGIPMQNNVWTQKKNEVELLGGWALATAPGDCSQGVASMGIDVNGRFITSGSGHWTAKGQQFTIGLGGPGSEVFYGLDGIGSTATLFEPGSDTRNTLTVFYDGADCTASGGGGSTVTVNSVNALALSYS